MQNEYINMYMANNIINNSQQQHRKWHLKKLTHAAKIVYMGLTYALFAYELFLVFG